MRISIGSDHRGFPLKAAMLMLLEGLGHQPDDMGCYSRDPVDYPDVAGNVARAVSEGRADRGILICGTGIGMSIAANKVPRVRAALCSDPATARLARQHNDANVLCMGGSIIGEWLAREIVEAYLSADFEGGRHARRVGKIRQLENISVPQPTRPQG